MGGKKAKKMKNSGPEKKRLLYAEPEQYYAIGYKFHNHSSVELYFLDEDADGSKEMVLALGSMRGKIIKRVKRVSPGDVFIITKRDFETVKPGNKPKVDIIHKYDEFERAEIMSSLPYELKSQLDKLSIKEEKKTVITDSSTNNEDEIIFDDSEKKYNSGRKSRYNYGSRVTKLSTGYLAGYDIPESEDEEGDESTELNNNEN